MLDHDPNTKCDCGHTLRQHQTEHGECGVGECSCDLMSTGQCG